MCTYITPEELAVLESFAHDDRVAVDPSVVERLASLHSAVERNLLKRYVGVSKRNAMLNERIERIHDKEKLKISVGDFAESSLDSIDVARGLVYQLQQRKTYRLSKSKVANILYEMYASWLYSKRERLFLEHPVASEYGPRFWRVYKHVNPYAAVTFAEWKSLCERNPGVAAFCKNAAEKYYDYSDADLSRPLLKSQPFLNASKEKNGGKWGKEIEDKEIYAWKDSQKTAK